MLRSPHGRGFVAAALMLAATGALGGTCSESAQLLGVACEFDLRDDFHTGRAICLDESEPDAECIADLEVDYDEGLGECDEVLEARLALCATLADAPHEPAYGPEHADDFVDPLQIGGLVTPNPWFPLVVGNRWVYESEEETIIVEVLAETKRIGGIDCIVVNDVVLEDGVLIEDTDDWFAQDLEGNIWYCGEIAENFEQFEGDEPDDPELVDIDGSWKAGRDGAKAGILIPAVAVVGDTIRQEVLYTDAEDVIDIVSVTASETAPAGSCVESCLQTRDYTPLEPGADAFKFYAPGMGLIVELEDGERVELVEFTSGGAR